MSAELLSQIIGYMILPMAVLRFLAVEKRNVLRWNAAVGSFYGAHFALIGHFEATAVALTQALFSYLASRFNLALSIKKRILIALVPSAIAFHFMEAVAWYSLLPMASFLLGRFAETSKNHLHMRFLLLPTHVMWFTFGVFTGSYFVMAVEVLTLGSNLAGIRRIRRRELAIAAEAAKEAA